MTAAHEAHVFALTGGIGSGKSSVAEIWRREGLAIVDADDLAREVVAPGSEVLARVAQEFGSEMLLPDGSLDRKKLGALVFADSEARHTLNNLVHPEVRRAAESAFLELATKGHDLICYVIPLLFETNQQDRFRPVVVVTATPLQQMERVAARDGLSPSQVHARVKSQIPLREKEVGADIVIVNGGTKDDLAQRSLAALGEVRKVVQGS